MHKDELVARLIRDFGYKEGDAYLVAGKLLALTSAVKPAFEKWWLTGDPGPIEVEGFTVPQLVEQHRLQPIAAFLTLDWLAREPEKAKAAIAEGYDRVR